jgi:hypothetical protein
MAGMVDTDPLNSSHDFTGSAWRYAADPEFDFDPGLKYDVKIVHIPSNSLVLDTVVEVR